MSGFMSKSDADYDALNANLLSHAIPMPEGYTHMGMVGVNTDAIKGMRLCCTSEGLPAMIWVEKPGGPGWVNAYTLLTGKELGS